MYDTTVCHREAAAIIYIDDQHDYFELKALNVQGIPVHFSLFLNQVPAGVTDARKIMQAK